MSNKRKMRESRDMWAEIERTVSAAGAMAAEKTVHIAGLLVGMADQDMYMIAASADGTAAGQKYADTDTGRVYICYSSEERARADAKAANWAAVPAADILRQVLADEKARAIAINTDSTSILLPVQYLRMITGGAGA